MSVISNNIQAAAESLYDCTCRVIVKRKIKAADGSVRFDDEILYGELPCRISYQVIGAAKKSSRQEQRNSMRKNDILAEEISAVVRLFYSPYADIPPGASVCVTKAGREYFFVSAGITAVFPSHKETVLTAREEFA